MNKLEASTVRTIKARPTVSIGLPVFNGKNYLREAIDSILSQTFTDFELIICDNASTDSTEEICRACAAKDSRVRYHRQPRNMGAAVNYDTAFHLSRGRYYKWAAHDDVLAPTFLERCVEVLDSDPGCVLVYPGTVLIDESGAQTSCYRDLLAFDSEDPVARLRHWIVRSAGGCYAFFGLLRPEVVATTGLHGNYPASDLVFLAEMAMRGRCRMIPEGLFYARRHEGNSVTCNPDIRDLAAWFKGTRPRWLTFKYHRILRGIISAIHRVPLTLTQKLGAYRVLFAWIRVNWDLFLKELLVPFFANGHATPLTRGIRRMIGRLRSFRR